MAAMAATAAQALLAAFMENLAQKQNGIIFEGNTPNGFNPPFKCIGQKIGRPDCP
jgi:hypothetical protein